MNILKTIQTVDTVISAAKPIIEQVTTKMGPDMKDFAERLYKLSEKYPSLEKWAETLEKGAEILSDLLFILGINSDPAEVLGAKVHQAEKSDEDFDSVKAYINYLHNEVELDKDKFEKLSYAEKMAYRTTGMAVEASAIGETLGVEVSADFVMLFSKIKDIGEVIINAAELIALISGLKNAGIDRMDDVCDYFEGKGDSDRAHTGKIIKDVFSNIIKDGAEEILESIKINLRKDVE